MLWRYGLPRAQALEVAHVTSIPHLSLEEWETALAMVLSLAAPVSGPYCPGEETTGFR